MAQLPGSEAEVFFGDTEKPLPDWRKAATDDDQDDDVEPTADEKAAVVGVLGFDPAGISDEA